MKYESWLKEENLLKLEGWARDGLSDEEICGKMGVSLLTLKRWNERFPKIAEALRKGKEPVDRAVENALLKRALGFNYEETVIEETARGYKRKVTKKFMPPDVTAQVFWLKHRKAKEWQDRQAESEDQDREVRIVDDIP